MTATRQCRQLSATPESLQTGASLNKVDSLLYALLQGQMVVLKLGTSNSIYCNQRLILTRNWWVIITSKILKNLE